MLHRKLVAEFETWHTAAKLAAGLPETCSRDGVLDPSVQKVVSVCTPYLKDGEAVWFYGEHENKSFDSYSIDDLKGDFVALAPEKLG